MQTVFGESHSAFKIHCADRDVFETAIYAYFCDNESLGDDQRRFLIERTKQLFGEWPVVFLDCDSIRRHSGGRFTGYRVIAQCAAFDPGDPESIEKAHVVFHQDDARIEIADSVLEHFAALEWESFLKRSRTDVCLPANNVRRQSPASLPDRLDQ